MADETTVVATAATDSSAQGGSASTGFQLVVPADIQQRFGDLIEMIKKSRSMNDEERQYWVDALSIMSDDQIQNLRDILENEQRQIQEVDEKYTKQADDQVVKTKSNFDSEVYQAKKQAREEAEKLSEHEESNAEEELLASLEGL